MSTPLRLLNVDDNPDDRVLTARLLRKEFPGVQIEQASDPDTLQRALARLPFDLVITDFSLGWTDGLEVLGEVQRRCPEVPVIMFTNTGNEDVCAAGMKSGLADYILKRPEYYPRLAVAVTNTLAAVEAKRTLAKRDEELEAALKREQRARADAENANRLKDDFLGTVSHELRTPLNAMLGWVHYLQRAHPSETELAEGLDVLDRNIKLQVRLVNDLLDVSRIITGKIRVDLQPVDLIPVVDAALESVTSMAESKGVALDRRVEIQPAPLMGDAARVQQVMTNLLSNAVKFTPTGGRVELTVNQAASHLEVVVHDTGEGIDPQFLPHVFDRLRQADSSIIRQHGGLGIGLSVVKHLVELHGGTVLAKSPGKGQGATFVVAFPAAAALTPGAAPEGEAEEPQPEEHRRLAATLEGLKILVVEDDDDARLLLRRILSRSKAEVRTEANVADGYAAFLEFNPDVLVSDIGMAGESGYDLIKRVRSAEATSGGRVAAIALTAYARPEDRERVLSAGYQVHVPKPVEPAELIASVATVTGRIGNE